jgi:DNA-binding CsgD family transcriptional regulator
VSPGTPPKLVGRDVELELLVGRLASVRRGSARCAVIEGVAGIGKSALLGGLVEVATERGVAVVRGDARPLEAARPFGPLIDALGLRGGVGDERRAGIARLLAEGGAAAAPLGPGQLQVLVVEAIIDLLESISDRQPLLLAIDDVQWAEGATLLTLEWVMRRLTWAPAMLVMTVRPAPRSPDLARLLDDAARRDAAHVRLGPLMEDDVAALAEAQIGAPLGSSLSAAIDRTGGSPLWVVELLRSLESEGRIDRSSGVAELRPGGLPDSVRELVAARLAELPEQTVRALRSASLLGESFSLSEMALVAGRRVSDVVDDLGAAFAAGLVADHRGVLVFRHQLVRDAIYEAQPLAARTALHRAAADALAKAGGPPEKVAAHLMLGAIAPDRAAALSLRDAAATVAPTAPGVATDLLRRATELLPTADEERDAILLEFAECAQRTGNIPESIQTAESVLGRPHDAAVDIPFRFVVISGLSIQRRGHDLIAHTDALLGNPVARAGEQAHALALSCLGRCFSGDAGGGESDARRGYDIAERAGDQAMMSWNLSVLSTALVIQGRFSEAIGVSGRSAEIAFNPPDLQARRRVPHMLHALALIYGDRFDDAQAAVRTAAAECTAVGSWMLEADVQLFGSEIALLRGEWDRAVPELEGGVSFALERQNFNALPLFHGELAAVAAARGDLAAGRAWLAPFEAELQAEPPCFGAEQLVYGAALVDEVAGNPEDALDRLHRFVEYERGQDVLMGNRHIAPAMTRLALALGRHDLAHVAIAHAERAAQVDDTVPSVVAAALRCRGMLQRDPDLMTEAISLADRSGRALDHAGTCEDAASVLAQTGQSAAARVLLETAIDRYEQLGATWLAARAVAAHRSLGGRRAARGSRARGERGWDSLTRSERAVAELVTEGLTNREIGARLFISPHTVNSHLRRTFEKLGVSNRAGLAAAVAADVARRTVP